MKRNILNINSLLTNDKQFVVDGSAVKSNLNYSDYIEFLGSLRLEDYSPSQEERVDMILIYSFFNDIVNKTKLYEKIDISTTTLKKDTRKLKDILEENSLKIINVPKKGVSVRGCERNFRVLCTLRLFKILDLDEENNLIERMANNPAEKLLASYSTEKFSREILEATVLLEKFMESNNFRPSYMSKKLAIIYTSLSLFRSKNNFLINDFLEVPLSSFSYDFFENYYENTFINCILSSIDYYEKPVVLYDSGLMKMAIDFIKEVQKKLVTQLLNYNLLLEEVYEYMSKVIFRQSLKYELFDDKVEGTHIYFENLFSIIRNCLYRLEDKYKIDFTYNQTSNLTLIIKKYITLSKVAGRNKKQVLIVTNSSIEKIGFFIERLKLHVDMEITGNINVNELHLLEKLKYDVIITFSNRIKSLLSAKGVPCLKLPFHLEQEHIDILFENGFSRSQRKIPLENFAKELSGKTSEEIESLLRKKYSDYFI